ncbi:creatininase family protein [Anaerotruncus sp.]|jgi:creatinine amidohydrolase|nr:creatininase family protein [Anaerotruncus sp.]MCI8491771.1 creatininase family protein [Anaerotruncus sp.]
MYPSVDMKTMTWLEYRETPFPGWAAGHAAITETSLMLYFAPELAHMDRIDGSAPAQGQS